MSDTKPIIRVASREDLPELLRLFQAYRAFYGEASAADQERAFLDDRLRADSGDDSKAQYFLAWSDMATGHAALGFMHLIPSVNTLAMRPIWFLEDLYVDPTARKQGVASSLLVHAEEFARSTGAERLTLATAHDNLVAQRLYANLGYVREDHFYYFHRLLE